MDVREFLLQDFVFGKVKFFHIFCALNGSKRHGVTGSLEIIIRERVCLEFGLGGGILTHIW